MIPVNKVDKSKYNDALKATIYTYIVLILDHGLNITILLLD